MPGDERDRALVIEYWHRRGKRPGWADRVDADVVVTRGELRAVVAQLRRERSSRGRGR
jgi:hypothetical protein